MKGECAPALVGKRAHWDPGRSNSLQDTATKLRPNGIAVKALEGVRRTGEGVAMRNTVAKIHVSITPRLRLIVIRSFTPPSMSWGGKLLPSSEFLNYFVVSDVRAVRGTVRGRDPFEGHALLRYLWY